MRMEGERLETASRNFLKSFAKKRNREMGRWREKWKSSEPKKAPLSMLAGPRSLLRGHTPTSACLPSQTGWGLLEGRKCILCT